MCLASACASAATDLPVRACVRDEMGRCGACRYSQVLPFDCDHDLANDACAVGSENSIPYNCLAVDQFCDTFPGWHAGATRAENAGTKHGRRVHAFAAHHGWFSQRFYSYGSQLDKGESSKRSGRVGSADHRRGSVGDSAPQRCSESDDAKQRSH
jgi:hypothetical protein